MKRSRFLEFAKKCELYVPAQYREAMIIAAFNEYLKESGVNSEKYRKILIARERRFLGSFSQHWKKRSTPEEADLIGKFERAALEGIIKTLEKRLMEISKNGNSEF